MTIRPFVFALATVWAAQAQGAVTDISALCSDPMTNGAAKQDLLVAQGWAELSEPDSGVVIDLAAAHIMTIAAEVPAHQDRWQYVPQLASNFDGLIRGGTMSLWQRDDEVLALAVSVTADGLENLACYYAAPRQGDMLSQMGVYGTPEIVNDGTMTAMRFDEVAIVTNPDRSYNMFSIWTRNDAQPQGKPLRLTDAYRLERVQQP